jgi:hypothetical protein
MQGEHFFDSPEYSFRLDEYEKRLLIINIIRDEVNNTIQGLHQERMLHQSVANRIDYLFFSVMMARIDNLSGSILSMSEYGIPVSPLDLDDPYFHREMEEMTINHAWFFRAQHTGDIRSTIKNAEVAGTDLLLDVLLPSTVDDENNWDSYSFPWRKDLLDRIGYLTKESAGGWEELSLGTRLPNIEIVHAYPPGERTIPKRIVRLKM